MGNEAKPRKGLSKTTLWFGIFAVIMSVIGCNIDSFFKILLMAGGFIFGGLAIIFAIIAISRKQVNAISIIGLIFAIAAFAAPVLIFG